MVSWFDSHNDSDNLEIISANTPRKSNVQRSQHIMAICLHGAWDVREHLRDSVTGMRWIRAAPARALGGCMTRAMQIWPFRLEHRLIEASL